MVNEPLPPSPAMAELTSRLFALSRALRSAAQRGQDRGDGVRRSDISLLRLLKEHGAQRPGALADHLGVGPSVVSRQLAPMTSEGLVTRRADPADGRADLVEITDAGLERLAELVRQYVELLSERFAHWEPGRVEDATRFLTELAEAVNGADPRSASPAVPSERHHR